MDIALPSAPPSETYELGSYIGQTIKDMGLTNIISFAHTRDNTKREPPTWHQKIEALFSYWAFVDLIGFHGGSANFSECHREMVGWATKKTTPLKQLVLEARGMLKSTCLGVGYVLWRIYQNPNLRLFYGSSVLELSTAFIREIKEYLEDPWLIEYVWNARPHVEGPLIPNMEATKRKSGRSSVVSDVSVGEGSGAGKKVWRGQAIQILRDRKMKEPTVTAGSVGQVPTGFHFDELILDDVVTFKNVTSPDLIKKTFSWINDLLSVLDPPYFDTELAQAYWRVAPNLVKLLLPWCISGGRQRVLGTRYDKYDYYGFIKRHQDELGFATHEKNIYVNGKDASDGYRWPEKWNEAVERQIKANLTLQHGSEGKARWYSQYINTIVVPDDKALNFDSIAWYSNHWVHKMEDGSGFVQIRNDEGTVLACFKPFLFADPSTGGDYAAVCVVGKDHSSKHYWLVDYWHDSCKSDVWIPKVYELAHKWNIKRCSVEMVAGFNELETTFRTTYYPQEKYGVLHLVRYVPSNQSSKQMRIENTLGVYIYNGFFHAPAWVKGYKDVSDQFTFLDKATVHDDGPDVMNQACETCPAARHPNQQKNRKQRKVARRPQIVVNPRYGGVYYA